MIPAESSPYFEGFQPYQVLARHFTCTTSKTSTFSSWTVMSWTVTTIPKRFLIYCGSEKSMKFLQSAAVCLLTINFALGQTTQLPNGVQRVTTVEGITEYRLENGLKVLLFPDPTKNTVTVNITYLVGSRNENYGETGMAHLLEHLVFKGTPKHPEIPKELDSHGTRPNGTTWFDR